MSTSTFSEIRQLRQFFEQSADQYPHHIALICDKALLSYQELEWRANQLANYLLHSGINASHSVGIFLERSLDSYIAILAVLKTGAAYVPIEVEYPDDRVNYILNDMPFHSVITSSTQLSRQTTIQFPPTVVIDQLKTTLAKQSKRRPPFQPNPSEQLCYVIYTSGSTGKPKGVEITQANICHYVSTAKKLYQMTAQDRVYQGFSLAFDASLEELWMAFASASTLIACTKKDTRSGVGLIEFLQDNQVTVFSTVPTLLATLKGQLPNLRLLILGGEACSANLIQGWSRPGLQILNTYGPTEATVIASYADCEAGKPITIGKPLPGYEILILDEQLKPVPIGQEGELCIAGQGIARGYVNRPQVTATKFVNNPNKQGQRLYRTGDLASINAEGNLVFLGRIDDQIKLRGFRIELNEIEMAIMESKAISEAVVALQELDNPTLVAYLLLKQESDFELQQFKEFLRQRLPHYMIPTLFEVVESFPLLASGKVDRKALPKPKNRMQNTPYVAAQTDLEQEICKVWEEEFQYHPISVEADFFYDLGGHSLSAARVVSNLRQIGGKEDLSILDLYLHPTIKRLAEKFNSAPFVRESTRTIHKNRTANASYYLCAIGQFFGCLLQYAISAWQLLTVVFCYSWVATRGSSFFSKESIGIFLALFLGMPIASLTLTICAKWILVGRIKPGVYKLWGWFYFRWWLVERLQKNIFSPKHFIGSPLIVLYYRLLGAKIGKNCYIGSANVAVHDLLTLGDNSSIGYDSRLQGYIVEDGWLKIGSITIGKNCFIGARSVVGINTLIQDNGKLDHMSMLPRHSTILDNQFFSGSPAKATVAAYEHITNQIKTMTEPSAGSNFFYGMLHYFCLVFARTVYYLCYFPALILLTHFHEETHYLLTVFFAAPLGAIFFLGLHYLGIAAFKKLLMNQIRPGIYSLKSFYYLRQWTIVKLVDINEVYIMADTLYLPYFMRFLGAKLGKHVEMGETPHLIPDLLTIQDEGFIASSAALAWPNVYLGSIKFAPVQVGRRGFIGNMSLLPLGDRVGEGGLLGCMSITPPNNKAADSYTAWLGSPAVFLPKREIVAGYSDTEKFTPTKKLFYTRLAIEFVRIIMPTTLTLIRLFTVLYILSILFSHYSLTTLIVLLPAVELLVNCGLVTVIIGLKWLILGRLKPATKPLWNIFIWKNDVIEYSYNYFINSHFTELVLGTPFVALLLRCLGAKIGKRVFIDTPNFAEFDLITIADEVCLNSEAVIQTHLYEDRIFKMSTINIREGCNVGVASIVLYNTVMEKNSTLGNFSLLMKGERLPANTGWQGVPAQPMRLHYEQPQEKLWNAPQSLVEIIDET